MSREHILESSIEISSHNPGRGICMPKIRKLTTSEESSTSSHDSEHGTCASKIRKLITNGKLDVTGKPIARCCILEYINNHGDDITDLKFTPNQWLSTFEWKLRGYTCISRLDVSRSPRVTKHIALDHILHVVERSPSLTYLNLSGNLMITYDLTRLINHIEDSKIPNLRTLILSDCMRGSNSLGSSVANLSKARNLVCLDLSFNGIVYDGLVAVCQALECIGSFAELNLEHCRIGSKTQPIGKLIRQSTSLTKLNLNKSEIGSYGIMNICDAITSSENPSLTELNLSHNALGMEGSKAMARLISQNKSIEILHMYGMKLYIPYIYKVVQSLERNSNITWLNLGATMLKSTRALEPHGPCSWDIQDKRYALMGHLSDMSTDLYIPFDAMQPPYALGISIANNYSITTLRLNSVYFEDDDIIALLKGLTKNETLTYLSLKHNNLGVEGLTHMANYIAGPTKDDPRYLMERECNICTLILANNLITQDGFGPNQARIVNGPNLTNLDLSHNSISTGARFIFDALRKNETLTNLKLSGCNIPTETTFIDCLRINKYLETLDLSNNPMNLHDMGITPSVFKGLHIRGIRLPPAMPSHPSISFSFYRELYNILDWNRSPYKMDANTLTEILMICNLGDDDCEESTSLESGKIRKEGASFKSERKRKHCEGTVSSKSGKKRKRGH